MASIKHDSAYSLTTRLLLAYYSLTTRLLLAYYSRTTRLLTTRVLLAYCSRTARVLLTACLRPLSMCVSRHSNSETTRLMTGCTSSPTCVVKGGGIGGFGGGWLEHLRQWLGAQWPGLSPWLSRAARSRQGRRGEAQEPSSALPRGYLDPAAPQRRRGTRAW